MGCLEIVESVLSVTKKTLQDGEIRKMSAFGNFVVKEKNVRRGWNPQTGEEINIKTRRRILKEAMNK